ncbi:MAG: hypothetical protein DI536_34960 [Archangium gephyra]|uniref:Uncharacterized protein n=1 Tax=Archangium gephyra TaxID=48 RepID=A0A2W5STE5_9BACT|nr:MAG: hypothetical protein DI536_34960 [Archangium gephyra]
MHPEKWFSSCDLREITVDHAMKVIRSVLFVVAHHIDSVHLQVSYITALCPAEAKRGGQV